MSLSSFSRVLLCAALIAMMVLAPVADAQRGRRPAPPPPEPRGAQHVVIMDGASGAILACDRCHEPVPPASMSKLMTILIVAEALRDGRLRQNQLVPISENAWRHGAVSDGSHMFLRLNSQARVGDLVRGVIIVSANDAAVALAEAVAGSEAAFVARMNRRARELGLRTARFANATGLDDPNHMISTADLARLARHIIRNHPDLYRLYSERTFTYNSRTQENRNPLLGAFNGADGVKTGRTESAGYGLIGSAQVDGQRRIIAFNGTATMAERRSEALRLMSAAFGQYEVVRLAEANTPIAEAELYLGARRTAPLVSTHPIVIGVPIGERDAYSARVVYDGPIRAPVRQGARLGRLIVTAPDGRTEAFPLVAGRNVGRANWFQQAWEGVAQSFAPRE